MPIYIRDGAIIPWFNGKFRNAEMSLTRIELHTFIKERSGRLEYYIDDRETRRYLEGRYNTAHIEAESDGRETRIVIREKGGYPTGTVEFAPVIYGAEAGRAVLEQNGRRKSRRLAPGTRRWVGIEVAVRA